MLKVRPFGLLSGARQAALYFDRLSRQKLAIHNMAQPGSRQWGHQMFKLLMCPLYGIDCYWKYKLKSYIVIFLDTLRLLFLWLSSSWKVLCWHLPETQLMSYCTISLKILAQCAKMNFMRIEAFVHWLDSQYRTSYCTADENDIQKAIKTNLGGFIK